MQADIGGNEMCHACMKQLNKWGVFSLFLTTLILPEGETERNDFI